MLMLRLNRNLPRALACAGVVAAMAIISANAALAQSEKLPKGEEILDRYVDVTGGKDAYEKLKNRVATGTFEMPTAGLKGNVKVWQVAPDRMYSTVDIEGMGTSQQGYDGEVAWEMSAMVGPRILEGKEKGYLVRNAIFNSEVNWRKLYKKAETVGLEDVDGKPAYKVQLTTTDDTVATAYYNKDSGLLVRMDMTVESQMGELPIETYMGEYRKVDGISIPLETRQKVMGQEQIIKMEKIEHNVDIPKDRFDLPAEIKELRKAATSAPSAPPAAKPEKKD